MKKFLLSICLVLAASSASNAATVFFDLAGRSGAGLLPTNENPNSASGTATGGELLGGITFDDVTSVLSINVGWGSANGFSDLTGSATVAHIHGATANGGEAAFTQNASSKYNLHTVVGSWNPSASAGGFNGTVAILAGDVPALLNGQFYINVHTSANGPGEIRGNLVQVPEPTASVMGIAALGLLTLRRRR